MDHSLLLLQLVNLRYITNQAPSSRMGAQGVSRLFPSIVALDIISPMLQQTVGVNEATHNISQRFPDDSWNNKRQCKPKIWTI